MGLLQSYFRTLNKSTDLMINSLISNLTPGLWMGFLYMSERCFDGRLTFFIKLSVVAVTVPYLLLGTFGGGLYTGRTQQRSHTIVRGRTVST